LRAAPQPSGDRNLIRRPGQLKAALDATVTAHDPGMTQLTENVLQEVQRNALRSRYSLSLYRLLVRRIRKLDRGPHRVDDSSLLSQ
jgi:hypothetical protein